MPEFATGTRNTTVPGSASAPRCGTVPGSVTAKPPSTAAMSASVDSPDAVRISERISVEIANQIRIIGLLGIAPERAMALPLWMTVTSVSVSFRNINYGTLTSHCCFRSEYYFAGVSTVQMLRIVLCGFVTSTLLSHSHWWKGHMYSALNRSRKRDNVFR